MVRNRAEQIAGVDVRETPAAAGSEQDVVIYGARFAGGPCDFFALRPLDFDRRQTEKQWAWKIALSSNCRLADSLFDDDICQTLGQRCRGERLDLDEVDGAGDTRLQSMGGEAPDGAYSRLSGGNFRPILDLAPAKRRDHSHAGNDDDRTIEAVTRRRLRVTQLCGCQAGFKECRHETASTSAIPSPRQ